MSEEQKKRGVGNQGRKANKATVHYRLMCVYNELQLFRSNTQIRAKFTEEWGVSPRTVDTYIKKANKHIREDFDIDRHEFLLKLMHCYEHVATKAMETNQLSNTLGALNAMAKLARLDPSTNKNG